MKLLQYVGPFSSGDKIKIPGKMGYRYIHIGIQAPYRQPISLIKNSSLPIDLTINGVKYRVNEKDILEFDDIREVSWDITFNSDLPWGSIVDIAYEIEE